MLARLSCVLVGGMLSAFALGGSASAASGSTHWVDGDGHAGPGGCGGRAAAYTTVQAAVDASDADDTVLVCPGTYVEQVRIRGHRDGLTIRGVSPWTATIETPSVLAHPLGFRFLVLIQEVDDVTIQGLRLRARTAAPCQDAEVVIGAIVSQRTSIRGVRISASGGAGANADCGYGLGVAFTDSRHPTTNQSGDPSLHGSLSATYDLIEGFSQAGIGAFGQNGGLHLYAAHDSIRHDQGAVHLRSSAFAGPAVSPAVDDAQAGIFLIGRSGGVVIHSAIRAKSPDSVPALQGGIYVLQAGAPGHPHVEIRDNLLRGARVGIGIEGARGAVVARNVVRDAIGGIEAQGVNNSTISGNDVRGRMVGIGLGGDSSGNRVRGNTASSSYGDACSDDSVGGGTAGTANTWTDDIGAPSSPGGLCTAR